MDPRIKSEEFSINASCTLNLRLSTYSIKPYILFNLFELNNVANLTDFLIISPSNSNYSVKSSLYKNIVQINDNEIVVSDAFGDEYYFFKQEDNIYHSYSTEDKLTITGNEYHFKRSDDNIVIYPIGSSYPNSIYKKLLNNNSKNYSILSSGENITKIVNERTYIEANYSYINNHLSCISLTKNNNEYERISIFYDSNSRINRITRSRENSVLEGISINYSSNYFEILNIKTNKKTKIEIVNNKVSSIIFGMDETYYANSRISYIDSNESLIANYPDGHFKYYSKSQNGFEYIYDDLGNVVKEIYEQKIDEAIDSIRVIEITSFKGNANILKNSNLFSNGFVDGNLFDLGYEIDADEDEVFAGNLTNNYFRKILGNQTIVDISSQPVTIAKTIYSECFSPNRPYFFSFWCSSLLDNPGHIIILYRSDERIVKQESHDINGNIHNFCLNYFSLSCEEYFTSIEFTFYLLGNSETSIGAISLIKSDNITKLLYDNDANLIKISTSLSEKEIDYIKNNDYILATTNDNEFASSNDGSKSFNAFGGTIKNQFNEFHELTNIITTDFSEEIPYFVKEDFGYDNGNLIYHRDTSKKYENYNYQNYSDELSDIDNDIYNTNITINYSRLWNTYRFKEWENLNIITNVEWFDEDEKEKLLYNCNNKYIGYYDNYYSLTSFKIIDSVNDNETSIIDCSYVYNTAHCFNVLNSKTINGDTLNYYYFPDGKIQSLVLNGDYHVPIFEVTYNEINEIVSIYDGVNDEEHFFEYDVNGNTIYESHPFISKATKRAYSQILYQTINDSVKTRNIFTSNNLNTFINQEFFIDAFNNIPGMVFINEDKDTFDVDQCYSLTINNCSTNIWTNLGFSFIFADISNSDFASLVSIQYNESNYFTINIQKTNDIYQLVVTATGLGQTDVHNLTSPLINAINYICVSFIICDGALKIRIRFNGEFFVSNYPINTPSHNFNSLIYFGRTHSTIFQNRYLTRIYSPFYIFGDVAEEQQNKYKKIHSLLCTSKLANYTPIYSKYSYEANSYENFIPLKDTLEGNNNQYPITIKNNPNFIFDNLRNHKVLSCLNNQIIYRTNYIDSIGVLFKFRVTKNDIRQFVINIFSEDISFALYMDNEHHLKLKIGNSQDINDQIICDYIGFEWNNVSISFSSIDRKIYIIINNVQYEYSLHSINESNFHICVGASKTNSSIEPVYSLNGYIENLVYVGAAVDQSSFRQYLKKTSLVYSNIIYDGFGRIKSIDNCDENGFISKTDILYKTDEVLNNKRRTYSLPVSESHQFILERKDCLYSYDNQGRIVANNNHRYEYDSFSRLSKFIINGDNYIEYQYDDYGNIVNKRKVTDGTISDIAYTYSTSFPTLLTKYGNNEYSYNGLYLSSISKRAGRFLILEKEFSYIGNKISTIRTFNDLISYQYNSNGLISTKIVKNRAGTIIDSIKYIYDDNKLILEIHNDYKLYFEYDALGRLYSISKYLISPSMVDALSWKYYYLVSISGDVIGLSDGINIVVDYLYDPFGNLLEVTDSTNDNLSNVNPFRYKSYYYDVETGLYWLSSRYYDPEIGRFISPDSVDYLDPSTINGLNLYAYCGNDPVNYYDPSGHLAISTLIILGLIAVGAVVGGTVAGVNSYNNGNTGWELVGDVLGGALIGGAIGGIVGYFAAPGIAAMLSSTGTIGGALAFAGGMGSTGAGIAISSVGQLALAGAVTSVGVLSGITVMAAQTRKSGGYYGERWPGDPHKPDHVHLRGNGIDIRIGRDGKPLPGEDKLGSQARKALERLWDEFVKLFNRW